MTTEHPKGPGTDPGAETLLVGYLRKALASIDDGHQVVPAEVCRDHPELAGPLAEALGLRGGLADMQRVSLVTDPAVGKVLNGRYRLDARLGSGGMGVVYRATDLELKREVAVKLLSERVVGDPIREQRFLREAELLAVLKHPHVVDVFDRGRAADGSLFLVMELLEGASLAEILAALEDPDGEAASLRRIEELLGGRPLPERSWLRTAVRWVAELTSGLAAAHERGIFHRDVKPSNVFIRRDHTAVLLDFGIAARDEDSRLTATETTIGTPWYMAPEQAEGKARGDASLDVYGLTASLYHLLSGKPPFEGTPSDVILKLRTEDPVPASRHVPALPRDLQAILEKGMERDPARRYGTMAPLEEDLVAFLDHRPVSVRPLSALGRRWRRIRRAPAKSIAVVATVLVLVSVTVIVPLWSTTRARASQEQKAALQATLPVLIAIEGTPDQRPTVSLTDHEECDALLRRILELDPDDLPTRLVRASLLLDKKDHEGAAAELAEVESRAKSWYMREVARRYAGASRDRGGIEAVDLEKLPEPVTDQDRFVAGFHELRNRHRKGFARRAETLLASCKDTYLPARDLYLIALLALGDEENILEPFQKAHDEALKLAEVYERETARTLSVRGACLVALKRYQEAVPVLLAALELRPDRHSPLQNLGVAYRRLGDPVKAVEYLEKAFRIRPEFWNTKHTLAQVYSDLGEYERAYHLALEIPESGPGGVAWKRHDLLGQIRVVEAISLSHEKEYERSRAAAEAAADHFAQAKELATDEPARNRLENNLRLAVDTGQRRLNRATTSFLNLIRQDPRSPHQIQRLASLLPEEGLDAVATRLLNMYLRTLAKDLAGSDRKFQEIQDKEIARIRKVLAASRPGEGR